MTGRPDPDPEARDAYIVVPAGTGRRQLVAFGVAVAVLGGLIVWGVLVAPVGPNPPPSAPATSPVVNVTSSPPVAVAPGPTLPLPAPDGDGLPSVDEATEDDAFAVLAIDGGWRQCPMWRALGGAAAISAEEAGASLAGGERTNGMHELPDADGSPRRFWVGGTEDDAVRGFGGTSVVHVDGASWTAIPDGSGWQAVRLEPIALGTGPAAWQLVAHAYPAPYCLADSVGGPDAAVFDVPQDGDPLQRLFAQAGWIQCRTWQRIEQTAVPDAGAIDAAIDASGAGDEPGWVTTTVPAAGGRATRQVRLLVDPDPAHAASRHGSRMVVVGTGEPRRAWMTMSLDGRPFAVSFDVLLTPAGRTAWVPTGEFAGVVGSCPGAAEEPAVAVDPSAGTSSNVDDNLPAIELLRGVRTASAMLRERLDWTGCRMLALESYGLAIPGAAIDRAAVAAGIEAGPLPIDGVGSGTEPVVVFLGRDVVDLARWAGVPVVALDGRPLAWLADETRADEWQPILTPAGRTAWMQTGASAWPDGGCDPPPDAIPAIDGVRSLTCWTDHDRCLEAIEIARGIAPEAFTPSTEVAAALGHGCPPTARCAWTGPNDPVLVTATPAGWASPDKVRVFATGLRRLSGTSKEVPMSDVAPVTLAIASRPAAALPVPEPVDLPAPGAACTGDTLDGVLRGSPWDTRVAWVGETEVTWPGGYAAAFVPDLRLLGPGGEDVAGAGDRVGLVGRVAGVEGGRFEACAVERVAPGQP